jgi:hypothetical protein
MAHRLDQEPPHPARRAPRFQTRPTHRKSKKRPLLLGHTARVRSGQEDLAASGRDVARIIDGRMGWRRLPAQSRRAEPTASIGYVDRQHHAGLRDCQRPRDNAHGAAVMDGGRSWVLCCASGAYAVIMWQKRRGIRRSFQVMYRVVATRLAGAGAARCGAAGRL